MSGPLSRPVRGLLGLLLALSLAACGAKPTPAPVTAEPVTPGPVSGRSESLNPVLPGGRFIADWSISEPVATYDPTNLFNLVDGQADSFFAYNFVRVTTQRYENTEGTLLTVQVWEMATPTDAYGLFTASRAGTPVKMGIEGDTDPGRRVAFWQNAYYVVVNANKTVPDIQVLAFADYIARALPIGGEHPAVVKALPAAGLVDRGFIYFHQESSMQNELYLGGTNVLGLSPATEGVVARYTLDGAAHLVLVQYPGADPAAAALAALRQAKDVDFITGDVKGATLAAVFGKASAASAATLLQAALAGVQP